MSFLDDFMRRMHEDKVYRYTGWRMGCVSEEQILRRLRAAAALPSTLDALIDAIDWVGPAAAKKQLREIAKRIREDFPEVSA